ncbi:hypothetical protein AWH49_16645 [Domibacillus aminovorans]|uniref:Uncharacterized protein n=1 Tax=Domibacillus aminovorans TaxID=29332 RepID=A0A177L469_9BACI|nr:hypothetical protein AWH49_16645 [Domibacillus aminovorans]
MTHYALFGVLFCFLTDCVVVTDLQFDTYFCNQRSECDESKFERANEMIILKKYNPLSCNK